MMMWCGNVENFSSFFLLISFSPLFSRLSTVVVNSFPLILSRVVCLSTILFFGANLRSLYLFSAKNRGNVCFQGWISCLVSTHFIPLTFIHTLFHMVIHTFSTKRKQHRIPCSAEFANSAEWEFAWTGSVVGLVARCVSSYRDHPEN